MKRYFILLSAVLMLGMANLHSASIDPNVAALPEYKGDINNPEIREVFQGKGYVVIELKGKHYVYIYK